MLTEAQMPTSQEVEQLMQDAHLIMGWEVEFVYAHDASLKQSQVFKQAQAELSKLGFRFHKGAFKLVPDGSIQADAHTPGTGMELVSAPQPLHHALNDLHVMFEWMRQQHHYTNESTGLHVNVSYQDRTHMQKVDRLKLVLLLGEKQIQGMFNRLLNSYTQSHVDILQTAITQAAKKRARWTQIREVQQLIRVLNAALDQSKYRTINFGKLEKGYLEFRIMGNQNYHENWMKVKNVIMRYAHVLKLALDPDSHQTEYTHELGKLFSTGLAQAQPTYTDLAHKYASVGSAVKPAQDVQILNWLQRAKTALDSDNEQACVKLLVMCIMKADAYTHVATRADLINAAALSYRVLIKRWLGWNVNQFVQAMHKYKIAPNQIKTVHEYLDTY